MEVVKTDRASDEGFFEELERAAKGLSVVNDRASSDELRRLFSELQDSERTDGEIRTAGLIVRDGKPA